MKLILYGILIAAALLVPKRPLELGKLKPVEVIRIEQVGEQFVVETDTGDSGRGATVSQAVWNLRETTAGTVYMDTAEYVLLPADERVLVQIAPHLRGSVRLCHWQGEIKLEETGKYLDVHKPSVMLKQYKMGMPLQILKGENGRLHLQEKTIEKREKST